jgi:hypothetical protein
LIFGLLSFVCFSQPCRNLPKYVYGDTVTICGRVSSEKLMSYDIESGKDTVNIYTDSVAGHELKYRLLYRIYIKMPIAVTPKKIEREAKLDISETNIQEFEIVDSKKLFPDSLNPEQKELKGVFHHKNSEHNFSKVWFDLIEVK